MPSPSHCALFIFYIGAGDAICQRKQRALLIVLWGMLIEITMNWCTSSNMRASFEAERFYLLNQIVELHSMILEPLKFTLNWRVF